MTTINRLRLAAFLFGITALATACSTDADAPSDSLTVAAENLATTETVDDSPGSEVPTIANIASNDDHPHSYLDLPATDCFDYRFVCSSADGTTKLTIEDGSRVMTACDIAARPVGEWFGMEAATYANFQRACSEMTAPPPAPSASGTVWVCLDYQHICDQDGNTIGSACGITSAPDDYIMDSETFRRFEEACALFRSQHAPPPATTPPTTTGPDLVAMSLMMDNSRETA